MSSVLRTLQNLRDGVAEVADVTVAASGVRHTNAVVDMRINRAWMRWYKMLAESGDDTYLKSATLTTTNSTTTVNGSRPQNQWITIADTIMLIRGCDIYSGNTSIPMLPADFLERDDAASLRASWQSGMTGFPTFYRMGSLSIGGVTVQPGSVIEIFPWADNAYRIDLWYIPGPLNLTNPSDTLECVSSGDEWIINDAAMQTLRTDGLADSPAFSALAAANAKLEAEMRYTLACRGQVRKVDTFGIRNALKRWIP